VAETDAREVKKGVKLTAAAVTVTVSDMPWRLVPSLASSGPRDCDFTAVRTADGKTIVQFGDGVHGARPPAGGEIKVRHRGGGGNTVTVTVQRTATEPTSDQALWVAIRNRTRGIRFEFRERARRQR